MSRQPSPTPRATTRRSSRRFSLARAVATAVAVTAFAAPLATVSAQSAASTGFEARPLVGAFIPTGEQRDLLEDAVFAGGQLGYRFTPNFAVTGGLGWAPIRDLTGAGLAGGRVQDLDLYQYDVGIEGRLPRTVGATGSVSVTPFLGLGAGGRTFRYRDLDAVDAQTQFVGHGSVGVDVGPRDARWSVRVEGRDYVSAFKGLRGELAEREARNDVSLAAGLTIRFGGAPGASSPIASASTASNRGR
ncbi:MAG: outer membrane beta-barrel protein [Gemmatimonadota bacterium]